MYIAKPTKELLAWQDMELGVLIHYCLEIYRPELKGDWYKTERVREAVPPESLDPKKLEPSQWVRSAAELGAKYAVLVANHCTGFSLWDTKVNDFSIAHTKWRGGGGDICREFVEACREYGLKPGFYYSTGCNGYYNINDNWKWDYRSPVYQAYVKNVEAQVTELWTEYGELFEIWFDGGIVPPEQGGPDLTPILKKHQPRAICFQGPRDYPHDIRWVGNEDGLAPENCWAATNAGEARWAIPTGSTGGPRNATCPTGPTRRSEADGAGARGRSICSTLRSSFWTATSARWAGMPICSWACPSARTGIFRTRRSSPPSAD